MNSENKVHYPNNETGRRQHKKSLSDCGDINISFEENEYEPP